MEEQSKNQEQKSKGGYSEEAKAAFMRRRKLSRILGVQFCYQADIHKCWDMDDARMEEFRALIDTAFNDEEDFEDAPLMEDVDAAWKFGMQLAKGVASCYEELDGWIEKAAQNWKLTRIAYVDRAIMRLAAYEIIYQPNKVTPAIAINEAVDLAKSFGQTDASRFVNGVLDKIRKLALAPEAEKQSEE